MRDESILETPGFQLRKSGGLRGELDEAPLSPQASPLTGQEKAALQSLGAERQGGGGALQRDCLCPLHR